MIDEVRQKCYSKNALGEFTTSKPKFAEDYCLTEIDAQRLVSTLQIKPVGLRDYCMDNQYAINPQEDVFLYKKDFIDWLLENYTTMKEALSRLCVSRYTIKNNDSFFKKIVIGKTTLVRIKGIEEYIQFGGRWS